VRASNLEVSDSKVLEASDLEVSAVTDTKVLEVSNLSPWSQILSSRIRDLILKTRGLRYSCALTWAGELLSLTKVDP
jgi:hypothetical protein